MGGAGTLEAESYCSRVDTGFLSGHEGTNRGIKTRSGKSRSPSGPANRPRRRASAEERICVGPPYCLNCTYMPREFSISGGGHGGGGGAKAAVLYIVERAEHQTWRCSNTKIFDISQINCKEIVSFTSCLDTVKIHPWWNLLITCAYLDR